MTGKLAEFKQLANAEDYFEFFEIPYNPQVVHVNRLHILQKFSNYIKALDAASEKLRDEDRLSQYRDALQKAYEVFITSTPLEQKLFKVFNDKPKNVVLLTEIGSAD